MQNYYSIVHLRQRPRCMDLASPPRPRLRRRRAPWPRVQRAVGIVYTPLDHFICQHINIVPTRMSSVCATTLIVISI